MKRFGIGAAVGFVVVFGSFYLMGMRGEAGEHAFEALTTSERDDTSAKESSESFSPIGEPSVQESGPEANAEKSKLETKRKPSSSDDEMQVNLRKATDDGQKVAMAETKQKPEVYHKAVKSEKLTSAGAYSVQVASNTDKAASDVMLERLRAQGFQGYVQAATVNEKQYYRVRLGPVESKDAANELKEKALQIKGVSNAIVSKDL